jgi:formylmethanofuran dehydrogenase subunit E
MVDHFAFGPVAKHITIKPLPTPPMSENKKAYLSKIDEEIWESRSHWESTPEKSTPPAKRRLSFSRFAFVSSPLDAVIESRVCMKCEYCGEEYSSKDIDAMSDELVCDVCALPLIDC